MFARGRQRSLRMSILPGRDRCRILLLPQTASLLASFDLGLLVAGLDVARRLRDVVLIDPSVASSHLFQANILTIDEHGRQGASVFIQTVDSQLDILAEHQL
jgi:hypothetical protein